MNTKVLMTVSAAIMGVAGILLTFLPEELLGYISSGEMNPLILILQILGALYFAFAILNWMARGNIIGGIYSRPIAIGNVSHFFIGSMALLNSESKHYSVFIWVAGVVYLALAISFGFVLFRHPGKESTSNI